MTPDPSTRRKRRTERWVGLFVLAALLLGGGGLAVRLVGEYWIDRSWRIGLELDRGYGLKAGNEVQLDGVLVGAVEEIDIHEDGQVVALLGIKRRYRPLVTDRARFLVRQPLVYGDAYVEILGDPSGEPLGDGETRVAEVPQPTFAELGVTQERVTAMLDSVQSLLDNADAIVADVRSGESNLGRLVNDTQIFDQFTGALANLNTILDRAGSPDSSIGRLLSEDRLYRDMADLTTELLETLRTLRGEEDQAREAVRRLNEILADAGLAVGELQTTLARVNAGQGTLGRLVNDDRLYVEMTQILAELREAVEDVREQTPVSTFVGALLGAF